LKFQQSFFFVFLSLFTLKANKPKRRLSGKRAGSPQAKEVFVIIPCHEVNVKMHFLISTFYPFQYLCPLTDTDMFTVFDIPESGHLFCVIEGQENNPLLVTDDELCTRKNLEEDNYIVFKNGKRIHNQEVIPLFEKVIHRFPAIHSSAYSSRIQVRKVSLDFLREKGFLPLPSSVSSK
jgi:hypothetical protein